MNKDGVNNSGRCRLAMRGCYGGNDATALSLGVGRGKTGWSDYGAFLLSTARDLTGFHSLTNRLACAS